MPTEAEPLTLAPGASELPFDEDGLTEASNSSGSDWSFDSAHIRCATLCILGGESSTNHLAFAIMQSFAQRTRLPPQDRWPVCHSEDHLQPQHAIKHLTKHCMHCDN